MEFRTGYNYDGDSVSLKAGLVCPEEEDKTQQQFKEEVDINTIVMRFGLTQQLPEVSRMPLSGDFTGIGDYHSALNAVRKAEEAFMDFPAEIRARFENNPGKMLDFLNDERNREEAIKLGIVNKPPEEPRKE